MFLIKVNTIINGRNFKNNYLKLNLILNNSIFHQITKKSSCSNKFVSLDSPFHYKVPKSNLGIYGYKVSFYVMLPKNNIKPFFYKLGFLSNKINTTTFYTKKINL